MADDTRGDRGEKEEKEEKNEEKDEKGRGEKFRNDPLSGMAWAAVLIWVGIVLLASNVLVTMAAVQPWPFIFIGAGAIFLLEVLIRLVRPEYRRPVGGTVIFAVILIAIGLGDALRWEVIWPIVLIVIGAALLVGAMTRRR